MFYKKNIIIILTLLILLSNFKLTQITVEAGVDTMPPQLNSISIDKTSVSVGQGIDIIVDATDEGGSGIKSVTVYYSSPITYKTKYASLSLGSDGKYKGTLTLTDTDESGTWIMYYVVITDGAGNYKDLYNSNNKQVLFSWPKQDFSNCNFELSGTTVDTMPPQLNKISIDKTSVSVGQGVDITVDTTDEGGSGIKSVTVYYSSPITYKTKYASLSLGSDGKYKGTLTLTDTDESGTWIMYYVVITDGAGNYKDLYNSNNKQVLYSWPKQDFSNCNFELSGTTVDTMPPQLNSISIDKTSVSVGQGINIIVDATDEGGSGIKSVTVYYSSPITYKTRYASLSLGSDGKYKGAITLTDTDESGTWIMYYVVITDGAGNYKDVYNSNNKQVLYSWPKQDFSNCNFVLKLLDNTIEPLPQKCVIQNENWISNTINGDLYIGPQAVLTINGSVTVNGNIYVLGAIKNYGNLNVTDTIYASQFNWGNSTLYNGTVLMLGGTNSIGSMVASNNPIDIPFKLYESNNDTLVAFDGKISITGASLPVIDLYMDNIKVNYYFNGTFKLDLDTNNKQQVNFKTVDVFGNEKTISYKILNKYYDVNNDKIVNITDLDAVAKDYNSKKSDTSFQEQNDYNCDGVIDIYDLVKISKNIN